jgi:hypothetical protein
MDSTEAIWVKIPGLHMLSSSRATAPAIEINYDLIPGLLSSRARYLFALDAGVQEVYRI